MVRRGAASPGRRCGNSGLRRCALALSLQAAAVRAQASGPAAHPQCRDPLFETHWSGKNDIQTLTLYPHVKTNLKLCPAFNQKASCCHQTFESEQLKYFSFWRRAFENIFLRLNAHRESMIAALPADLPQADREQYEVALERYREVFSPGKQQQCFDTLLTYTAGMMCFACRPEWFHYTVVSGDSLAIERVLRVRILRSSCLKIWASCKEFGAAASALVGAIRDSAVARRAARAVENLDMFAGQQQLCDWMHDKVALHPFSLPTAEESNIRPWHPLPEPAETQKAPQATPGGAGAASPGVTSPAFAGRRLIQEAAAVVGASAAQIDQAAEAADAGAAPRRLEMKKELDVLAEGRASGFDTRWRDPVAAEARAPGRAQTSAAALAAILAVDLAWRIVL